MTPGVVRGRNGGRHEIRGVAAIAAVAFGLRLLCLGSQSLWGDELASVAFARMPASQLWSAWMVHETNPPLYYTLLHCWIRMFGDGEFAIRFPSVIIGTVSVVAAYLLGRKTVSHAAGLWAAGLLAIGGLQVGFSQEARGYVLASTAALFATLALAGISEQIVGARRRCAPWLLYVFAMTVALYSHTTMVFFALAANAFVAWLWWFRSERRHAPLLLWMAANLVCLAAWAWWGWITTQQLTQTSTNAAWMAPPTLPSVLVTLTRLYGAQSLTFIGRGIPVVSAALLLLNAALAVLLGLVAAHGFRRMNHPVRYLLVIVAMAVPFLFAVISIFKPIFSWRTIFWAQFAYLILLATGASALPSAKLKAAAGCLVAALFLFDCRWQLLKQKEPWHEAAAAIDGAWRNGDAVLVADPFVGFGIEYYAERAGRHPVVLAIDDPEGTWAAGVFHGDVVSVRMLQNAVRRYGRIWLVAHHGRSVAPLAAAFARKQADIELPVSAVYGPLELSLWRVER